MYRARGERERKSKLRRARPANGTTPQRPGRTRRLLTYMHRCIRGYTQVLRLSASHLHDLRAVCKTMHRARAERERERETANFAAPDPLNYASPQPPVGVSPAHAHACVTSLFSFTFTLSPRRAAPDPCIEGARGEHESKTWTTAPDPSNATPLPGSSASPAHVHARCACYVTKLQFKTPHYIISAPRRASSARELKRTRPHLTTGHHVGTTPQRPGRSPVERDACSRTRTRAFDVHVHVH